VNPTSTATKPAVNADTLTSLKNCIGRLCLWACLLWLEVCARVRRWALGRLTVRFMNYTRTLLLVLGRTLLVLAIGVPALLALIVAGALGPGGSGGFAIILTLGLCGLAWAFMPLIHAGRRSGLAFGAGWTVLAVWHFVDSAGKAPGAVVVCWVVATLFLAIKLKSQPPAYFPHSWHEAAAVRRTSGGA
jgi:hypothetical protein